MNLSYYDRRNDISRKGIEEKIIISLKKEDAIYTHKHGAVDNLLRKLIENLEQLEHRNLKLEVLHNAGFLSLLINNELKFKMPLEQEFLNKDIYYLENVISEITQDYKNNYSNIDILVCA